MAGGKGTRLRPLTYTLPKPLVPLHDKTLLDYIIEHAKKNGCDNIIICTGYLGNKIKEHIERNNYGLSIRLSMENKPLGSAGALHLIKDLLENDFFILYGDVYTTINLRKMLKFHKQKKAVATLALHISDHPQDSTVVTIDKSGKLLSFIEKPGNEWTRYGNITSTSLYLLKKEVINFIAKAKAIDFAKDVFPTMLKGDQKLFGYITKEYAKDIGTPERYKSVLHVLKK